MSRLRVAPIVEGHGESYCIRILLERVWGELLGESSSRLSGRSGSRAGSL